MKSFITRVTTSFALLVSILSAVGHAQSPTISSLSPTSGAIGASVTISGTNFGSTQGSSTVTFAGVAATASAWSATSITAAVPNGLGAGSNNVVVTVGGQASNSSAFTVNAPSISSVSPTSGGPGVLVTVSGNNFGRNRGTLTFNGAAALLYSWGNTSIQAYVPGEATTGNVVVNDGGLQSNGTAFTVAPIITSLSPSSGEAGTSVTITGTNFTSTTGSVTFNGVSATVSSWSSTQIVVTVPVGAITGQVQVKAGSITSNTSIDFSVPIPHVTGISPTSGTIGTQVTINGSGFQASKSPNNTAVYIGGYNATTTSWGDTQIVATVPNAAMKGAQPVWVMVNGVNSNQDAEFTMPSPTITSVNPSSGPVGTQVQVNGSGFGATQGSSTVTVNGIQATVNSWSSNQVTVTPPSTATTGPVTVNLGSISSNNNIVFTVPAPQVTSVSPTSGPVGTQVTINGSGFQATRGYGYLYFNNTYTSNVVSWSDTQIVVAVPANTTTGGVKVYANNGQASNPDVVFTLPSPVITGVAPSSGPVGTQVQINGRGFGTAQGSSTLTFNGQSAASIASWSDTQITATVPTSATTGVVKVTNGGVAGNTGINFTVPAPQVTGISPTSGPGNTQVTINGSGFQASQVNGYVTFNGTRGTVSSWSDAQVVATVPSYAGSGAVVVTANNQNGSNQDIVFTLPSPVISGVSPIAGAVGAQVQVNGSGFGASQGSSTLTFYNGKTATVTSWSDTQIAATVPSGAASGQVKVTEGGVNSNNITFTVGTVNVASISPTAGPTGTQVTVNGSGFGATQGTSTISFNGVTATSITSWSDSQIVATVPSSATTGAVKVVNGGTSSNTINFTVDSVVVTGITPSSGLYGTAVQINGSGFGSTQGSSTVTINGVSATASSWSSTQINATVPYAATTGPVQVTVGGVGSNTDVVFTTPNPVITSLSPSSGPVGTQIQVNGNGFGATQGSATLSFSSYGGNKTTASVISWSNTQIVVTVPSLALTGSVVMTDGHVSSNNNISFTVPPPLVTSISPTSGVVGTQLTINGSGFQATRGSAGEISFNGANIISYVSWSDTQIVVAVPTGAITGGVRVWANNSQASNQDVVFTMPSPTITSITPSSGEVATQVQVNGSGFGATQGSSTLTFATNGGNPNAGIVSWSDTQITATVPTWAVTGAVKITEGGVTSNNMSFTVPAPHITSLSPASGGVGTQVTINGSGFQATQGSSSVFFGRQATVTSWSDTQIVATVPANAVTGPVQVITYGVWSNQDVVFTMPNPVITGITPSTGTIGTQVTINGSGFGATQGSSVMAFRGTNANAIISSWSDTQIIATVPSAAFTGALQATVGGVASNNTVYFTFTPPQISSITPSAAGVGNTITIAGSGFLATQTSGSGPASLAVGGQTAIPSSWSNTQIITTVPSAATTGLAFVTVQGQNSNLVNFTVPNNVVSSVTPSTAPVSTQVTLTGAGFGSTQGSSSLTFNGQSPTSISSWSDGQIVAAVPVTSTTGPAVVTVNNVSSNNNVVLTVPPPVVSAMSPAGGIVGTQITISGSGFQANQRNSTLTFNGVAGTPTSWSDSQIVVTVPTSATTGPLLVTVNSISSSNSNVFVVPNMSISSLSPASGPVGGTVIIAGSSFGATQGQSQVNFNGLAARILSWSNTSITATVPNNATTGQVNITDFNGTSNGVQFTVENPAAISSLSPTIGPVGTSVTISGSGFGATQSNSTVQFWPTGTAAAVTSWSDTQIVATVPPGAATGPVAVVVAATSGAGSNFTITGTTQVSDSLGNSSSYTATMLGGAWVGSSSTGSGCSSCTDRGVITNTLDGMGNVLSATDELGHTTNYTYDSNDNLASVSAQLNTSTTVTTSYTYNSFGEVLTTTDPLGNVTTNTYDSKGNLLTVTTPAPNGSTPASVTTFAYNSLGELTQITDPLNNVSKLSYTAVGLISTITDAQNNVTTYQYDTHGNRTAITDALQNKTTFAYDAMDRLTTITYPDSTTASFGYDYRGRRTSVTDQNGKVISYAYDDADRLTSVTDAANNVTHYSYDAENNLLSITDASNNVTSFAYDAFGRVNKTTFPSTLLETYAYDGVGNLTSKVDRKGQSILYAYDALNRLTYKQYPDSTAVDYSYDLAGKITQVTDPTGTYGFSYDNVGRLIGTTTQYAFLSGTTFTNSYGYDANSNRTSFTAPDNSTNTYQYDTLNRLSNLTSSLTGQFTFGYDALSRRTSLSRPNGVATNYSYDSLSHLLSVLHQNGTTTLDGATYTYDNAGNRSSKSNQLNNITEQYTYDAIYQLKQVTQGATTTESYTYDPVGNRLSSLSVPSYTYNSSDELTSTSAATYTYDNNGNTLTKALSSGTTQYTWDFENRLSSVVLPGSGGTVAFKYDPFGRRIQKAFTQGSTTTTTNYVYDGANGIEEVDQNGNVLARYTQGAGIDEPLTELRSGTTSFYEADGLGSITSLTGSTGTVANSYTYDTFGNLTGSAGSITNPYQYTGRDYDSETGLRYYRARYYDSGTGRFISEDPLSLEGGVNFYLYGENEPTILTDPTGRLAEVICENVQQFYLGRIFSARHCRLRVGCGTAIPDFTYELNGRSAAQPINAEPFDPHRPGFRPPMKTPPNNTCCKFEQCLVNRLRVYIAHPKDLGDYDPVNHNSNWFVWEVVRSCSGDVNFDEFQIINGLPQYNFYGQMPEPGPPNVPIVRMPRGRGYW